MYRGLEPADYSLLDLDELSEQGVDRFRLGIAGDAEEAGRVLEGEGIVNDFSDPGEALEAAQTLREVTEDRIDLILFMGEVEHQIIPLG